MDSACTLALGPGESALDFDVGADAGAGNTMYVAGNTAELGNWNLDLAVPTEYFAPNKWRNRVTVAAARSSSTSTSGAMRRRGNAPGRREP